MKNIPDSVTELLLLESREVVNDKLAELVRTGIINSYILTEAKTGQLEISVSTDPLSPMIKLQRLDEHA